MGKAKQIIVKLLKPNVANEFVKRWHYSGKVVPNSQVHFGCFLEGTLHGVMSFGPSMMKDKLIGLVAGTGWNEFLELNRMAFDAFLPRNSESRCIAIALRMIRKQAPHIKWVVSFADGTQCGDGTIYRASGFVLTGIVKNRGIYELPDGKIVAKMTYTKGQHILKQNGKSSLPEWAKALEGYQFRYIYLLDKSAQLTVPVIPFSQIDEIGAGMYKGQKVTIMQRRTGVKHKNNASSLQEEKGGAVPTHTLQEKVIKKW